MRMEQEKSERENKAHWLCGVQVVYTCYYLSYVQLHSLWCQEIRIKVYWTVVNCSTHTYSPVVAFFSSLLEHHWWFLRWSECHRPLSSTQSAIIYFSPQTHSQFPCAFCNRVLYWRMILISSRCYQQRTGHLKRTTRLHGAINFNWHDSSSK